MVYMKKTFLSFLFFLLPLTVFAGSFDRDLFFGMRDDALVTRLQEFLRDQGMYSGPVTGNFFSLTKGAVRRFQEREGIDPPAGYFGPKTRARANALAVSIVPIQAPLTREEISARIQALQEQLQLLQQKMEEESRAVATSAIPAPTTPVVPPPPSVVSVSGYATSTFPAIEASFFKMGEFSVSNGTSGTILFSNFETILSDEMDSATNRNKKVSFLLRDGVQPIDPLISKTDFTFVLTPPKTGEPHRSVLLLPFPVTLASGEEKRISVWIEQMAYVRSGTLGITLTKTVTTGDGTMSGGFRLVLTKEPPL